MKYTSYSVHITTPSGNEYDEYSKFTRNDWKHRLSWSDTMFNSYKEIQDGKTVREIVNRAVCEHVLMSHSEEQRERIDHIVFDMHCGIGHVYVEWLDENPPEMITIPTQKYTTTFVDKTTGAKKRRKFHFHYENRVVQRGALCRAGFYRIEENNDRTKLEDDDPAIFEEGDGAKGWIFLSDRLYEHADACLKKLPYKYHFQAGFGGDDGTGLIDFCIENEETVDIEFPPLRVTYENVQYEFVFGDVDWSPLMEDD